jgi:two-component system chemotaxis sensor kinase CheA
MNTPNITGAALLGTGEPVVVLNPGDLIQSAKGRNMQAVMTPKKVEKAAESERETSILVVDDSITTRTLEKNILEAAGYRVTVATDGREALRQLEDTGVDLIVSDIDMPNMDGIAFTRAVRESADFGDLPVILVSSLESREHQEQGMHAGANAYIVKRGFDQAQLLATIERFL